MAMTIEVHEREGWPVVEVSGEVDLQTAPELRDRLATLLEGGSERLALDLSGVEFLDSTALSVMVGAHKRLLRNGSQGLTVVAASEPVQRVLTVTGLARVFSLYDSLDAALAP